MNDQEYMEIFNYLSHGQYTNCNTSRKRNIRRNSLNYSLQNGKLYRSSKTVVKLEEKPAVLHALHSDSTAGGHLGRDKTRKKVAAAYYWPGWQADVDAYVASCPECKSINAHPISASVPLHPIPVPNNVWSLIGIDLIGPLPETQRGNKYIVGVSDYFSKWVEAAGIPDKSALSVATFLLELICRLGVPQHIISDQGREFVNELNDFICSKLNISHRICSAYHPQSNGLRERDNRTLKEALRKVVNEDCNDWDEHLSGMKWTIRCISSVASPEFFRAEGPGHLKDTMRPLRGSRAKAPGR